MENNFCGIFIPEIVQFDHIFKRYFVYYIIRNLRNLVYSIENRHTLLNPLVKMDVTSFSFFTTKLKWKIKYTVIHYQPTRPRIIAHPNYVIYIYIYKCKEIDYLFRTKATSTTWAFFLIERNDLRTKKNRLINIYLYACIYSYSIYLKLTRWCIYIYVYIV